MNRRREQMPVFHTFLLALIVAASALGFGRAHAGDILILGSGVQNGTLETYSGGICTFDGAAIPRASIYFIGLEAELPPPTPQDPMRDEVHLRDGSVHSGPLVSIDADTVVTENATHRRRDVAWIWLTPMLGGQGQAAPSTEEDAAETEQRPSYEWAGTIKVENRYNGEAGRHLWQAEYRVKLLEVPSDGTRPGREIGTSFPVSLIEPVELDYEIIADQNWDRAGYKLAYGYDNRVVSGDVTMRGRAGGRITGQTLVDSSVLRGSLVRLDAPAATVYEPTASLADGSYYDDYAENAWSPTEAGWYEITIVFRGHDMPYNGSWLPPYKALSLYRGIRRGGMMPPFFDDPEEDFAHWVPNAMPDGTLVVGRLDHPDQTAVRGRVTYPTQGPGGPEDRAQITIAWSFTRARQ